MNEDRDAEDLYFIDPEPLLDDKVVIVRPVVAPRPFPTEAQISVIAPAQKDGGAEGAWGRGGGLV
jgi:hypothetical protein